MSYSAMTCSPEIWKDLYVFQRTPTTVDVRNQRETSPEEREAWAKEPGWARARRARFARFTSVQFAGHANDDYLAGKVADFRQHKVHKTQLSRDELMQKFLDSNFRTMEQIRARVDVLVENPITAAALKPYYP